MDEDNSMGGLLRWGVLKTCCRGSGKCPTINDAPPGGGIGLDGAGGNWAEGEEGATVKSGAGIAVEGAEVSSMEFAATAESSSFAPGDGRRGAKDSGKEGSGEGEEKGLGTGVSISGVCGDGAQCDGSVSESASTDGDSSAPGGGALPAGGGSSTEGGGSSAAGGGVSTACVLAQALLEAGGEIWPCIGTGIAPYEDDFQRALQGSCSQTWSRFTSPLIRAQPVIPKFVRFGV